MYKTLTEIDINKLKSMVEDQQLTLKNAIEDDFKHDELGTVEGSPDIHIYVKTTEEISAIMRYANDHKIAVTVRGSGTGLVGGSVALNGGILLDTSKMNNILELDKTNLTLTVEPGVLLLDIYEYVEKEGLFYAPDPGEKTATVGGNISTNAGGMRAVKYGVTRDWIRGLEVVLPTGEVVSFGGKVVKNSTGYALKDLMVGSEGTLGIITKATLKLMPKPTASVSLLVPFKQKKEAIEAAPNLIMDHVVPTALEYLEQEAIKHSEEFLGKTIPHNTYPAYLLVSYDGNSEASIARDVEIASDLCVNHYGAEDVYLIDTTERHNSVWSIRGGFLEAIKASTTLMDECDVVLPRSEIKAFLDYTKTISQENNLRIPYFGHVGDGNLHLYLCKDQYDEATWQDKKTTVFNQLYEKAHQLGGLVSGEHGIGYAKKTYMEHYLGQAQMRLMREIKQAFDPNKILNPRKIV